MSTSQNDITNLKLPFHPSLLVDDRFSVLDSDEPSVLFWDLLYALLSQPVHSSASLIDLLSTIETTLRTHSRTDYHFLQSFLDTNVSNTFWKNTWPSLAKLALKLPSLFPHASIAPLTQAQPLLTLSREQASCLIVHQFLCTLPLPSWQQDGNEYQDFHIWYGAEQPHPKAVNAYLTALFTYFERIGQEKRSEWPLTYSLSSDETGFDNADSPLTELQVLTLDEASTAPSLLGLEGGGAVISANKFIGFGRTGTQEELHVGTTPEACPAVLFTPPLLDNQALIITGAEAMVSTLGFSRDARCHEILSSASDAAMYQQRNNPWSRRNMIFMDALELDLANPSLGGGLSDLQPGFVLRELRKAFIGFRAVSASTERPHIYTGLWGCGNFSGNPDIKAAIQWCAASLAGYDLVFVCSGDSQRDFAKRLEAFICSAREKDGVFAGTLKDVLLDLKEDDIGLDQSGLAIILERL